MKTLLLPALTIAAAVLLSAQDSADHAAQPAPPGKSTQAASRPYQRPLSGKQYQQQDDFFHYSAKLVNKNGVDYGAWLEERRRAFLEASLTNPFFWYSALTTALMMLLMLMYGVRVLDERRKLWRAAELLTDVWNQDQYSRAVAASAVEKYNAHMADCNRVIETQLSGRPSATALDSMDFKERLEVVSAQRDAFDSENRSLKAELQKKEAMVSQMSARLDALERRSEANGTGTGATPDTEATRRLIARVNELQQQLEAEQRKNRQLKGA
jgi:hypothetical protein